MNPLVRSARPSDRPRRFVPVFVLVSCLHAVPTSAQPVTHGAAPSQVAPLADSLSAEAKVEYESARLLFSDGDFAGASTKFKRAHELSGDPRLLWNMAVCEKELRHYARATTLVERYLLEGGDRLTDENRRSATETRDALRDFYSLVTMRGVPAGATVLVDGVDLGRVPLDRPIPIDLGSHRLRVEHPSFEPYESTFEVPGNSPLTLPITMKATARNARLQVSATPGDSVIRVDGKALGTTRWEGALSPGKHLVQVTAPGHVSYRLELELLPKQNRSLDVALAPEKGATLWPWIAGGAAIVAGASVGGYFLFRKDDPPGSSPQGRLGTVYLP
jgi:hypothetical protein